MYSTDVRPKYFLKGIKNFVSGLLRYSTNFLRIKLVNWKFYGFSQFMGYHRYGVNWTVSSFLAKERLPQAGLPSAIKTDRVNKAEFCRLLTFTFFLGNLATGMSMSNKLDSFWHLWRRNGFRFNVLGDILQAYLEIQPLMFCHWPLLSVRGNIIINFTFDLHFLCPLESYVVYNWNYIIISAQTGLTEWKNDDVQFFFSSLKRQPTNRVPVRHSDPGTPLGTVSSFQSMVRRSAPIDSIQ